MPAMSHTHRFHAGLFLRRIPRNSRRHGKPRSRKSPRQRYLIFALLLLLLLSRGQTLFFWSEWHLPFALHFTKSYILLEPGDRYTLKINGIHTLATYKSSHSLIASVTQGGVVHAWKCGKTVITATLHGKKQKKIRCLVHVTELNKKTLTLRVKESARIYIKGFRFSFGVKYKSGDKSVARVTGTGKVTAVGKGKTVITVTCRDKEFECRVTVK